MGNETNDLKMNCLLRLEPWRPNTIMHNAYRMKSIRHMNVNRRMVVKFRNNHTKPTSNGRSHCIIASCRINNCNAHHRYKSTDVKNTLHTNRTVAASTSSSPGDRAEFGDNVPPTARQLALHALRSAVPMIGKCSKIHKCIVSEYIITSSDEIIVACVKIRVWLHGQHNHDSRWALR